MFKRKNFYFIFVFFATLLSLNCDYFAKSDSPIIARVGRSVLTLEDLNKSIPASYSDKITKKQRINYVKQWIDTELLYQAALKKKIHKEKKIRQRLKQMKKDLLGAEMITRLTTDFKNTVVSDDEIQNYYNENKSSFTREADVIKYVEIVVDNLTTGWKVRNLVKDDNFLDLASKFSTVPVQDPRSAKFVPVIDLPKEISDVAFRIRINGTTSPIKLDDGVHIVRVLDKQSAGETCLLEEVYDDILSTLSTQKQRQQMEFMLSDLRNKTDYEFNFDIIKE